MPWDYRDNKLFGSSGEVYEVHPHEFWYVAPARNSYQSGERRVRPLDFAFALHNAAIGEGLLASPTVLMHGLEPTTTKGGAAAEAELLLERIREDEFPSKASRLCCYFLNFDRATAEFRMRDSLRGNRRLARCLVVKTAGKLHFADMRIYEQLEGRPDDESLARKYWETFQPKDEDEGQRLEVLVDGVLYFPDWLTFPTLETEGILAWQRDQPPSGSTSA